jgi:hypothetical protein
VSRSIGAAFAPTIEAVAWSAVVIGIALVIWYFTEPSTNLVLCGAAVCAFLVWPYWWSVLDSIAMGGQSFSSQIPRFASDTPWWDTNWCKWAVEIAFVAASALFGMRHLNDPYG